MSHFPDEVWADWVRGVIDTAQSEPIREHLDSGCLECRTALETWQAVADAGQREASYEPPPDVLRKAVALFAEHRGEAAAPISVRVAELLFDSFSSPLPAGIRSLERPTRHLSYKAGSFFVDVRIEEQGTTGVASVVGQLMHHPDASEIPLEGHSVILTSGQATMAETTTNRYGEFSFEMDTARENKLAIGVGDEFAVVVPLSGRRRSS